MHPVDESTRRLVHVQYAAAAVDESLISLRDAVHEARRIGVSWAQIAAVLEMSPAAASDRFGEESGEGD